MFRDSRGVVHTVSSADPLDDLPGDAAAALARTLLIRVDGDLGGALERCEAVRELVDRWQDAFFAALPPEVDLSEETRWAAEAGLSMADVEAEWEDEEPWDDDEDPWDGEQAPAQVEPDQIELSELAPLDGEPPGLLESDQPPVSTVLPEKVVTELELALLLLPLRVRLEALVAAGALVDSWADLLADHEKALGHLVLRHGEPPTALDHESLADRHADLHAGRPAH